MCTAWNLHIVLVKHCTLFQKHDIISNGFVSVCRGLVVQPNDIALRNKVKQRWRDQRKAPYDAVK